MTKQEELFPQLDQLDAKSPAAMLQGFRYRPAFITESEERALADSLSALPLKPFEFHGYFGNRRVISFGLRYDYALEKVELADEPPKLLSDLRIRVAEFAGCAAEDFLQIGINEYRPGAGIGWHRDKPQFGEVVGLSLLSSAPMRFRRRHGNEWMRTSHILDPRSVYLLAGEVRQLWEHSVPPVTALRYAITFRTLASRSLARHDAP